LPISLPSLNPTPPPPYCCPYPCPYCTPQAPGAPRCDAARGSSHQLRVLRRAARPLERSVKRIRVQRIRVERIRVKRIPAGVCRAMASTAWEPVQLRRGERWIIDKIPEGGAH
jgi:hypothetical protein